MSRQQRDNHGHSLNTYHSDLCAVTLFLREHTEKRRGVKFGLCADWAVDGILMTACHCMVRGRRRSSWSRKAF